MVKRALQHLAAQYIFAGQPATGWRLFWNSVKLEPVPAVFQRQTVALVARTLLGGRGYRKLRATLPRFRRP